MQPTRRTWAVAGLAGLTAGAAWLFAHPALVVGTAGLGAWLIAGAYGFLRTVTAVDDDLALEVTATPQRTVVGDDVDVRLRGSRLDTDAAVTVRLELPAALSTDADARTREIRLREEVAAETTVTVTAPVAGEFTVPRPTVTVTDARGRFSETIARGPTTTLSAVPRTPDDLGLGAADRETTTMEGEYTSERRSRGTEPAEIREYVPGETVGRIDWNATARLADTYVREFEVESAVEARFVFDARHSTHTGDPGETPLDYLREVALGLLELAREQGDPVGLAIVDDDGVAAVEPPGSRRDGYERIRRRLRALEADPGPRRPSRRVGATGSLARRLTTVDRTDSPFLAVLAESLAERTPLPPDRSPVRAAVQAVSRAETGRTVLFTDDTDRHEVREAVASARRETGDVLVFLAPTVLFDPDGFTDLAAAYERYTEFDAFRRDLDARDGVTAVEVNPGDRSRRLLAADLDVPA